MNGLHLKKNDYKIFAHNGTVRKTKLTCGSASKLQRYRLHPRYHVILDLCIAEVTVNKCLYIWT